MDESRLWGGLGVVTAILGLAVIAPELSHVLTGGGHGLGATMIAVYGVGVALAVVVTAVVIAPSLLGGSETP